MQTDAPISTAFAPAFAPAFALFARVVLLSMMWAAAPCVEAASVAAASAMPPAAASLRPAPTAAAVQRFTPASEPLTAAEAGAVPAWKSAAPVDPSSTALALTRIEEETLLLKARLQELETEAQIAQRNAELDRIAGVADDRGATQVRAVEGLGSALRATLWNRSMGEFEAKVGDTLGNGMRIVAIRPSEVLALPAHGKKPIPLPMAVTTGATSFQSDTGGLSNAAATGVPGLPPLPRN